MVRHARLLLRAASEYRVLGWPPASAESLRSILFAGACSMTRLRV